jgi:hypothetical protein
MASSQLIDRVIRGSTSFRAHWSRLRLYGTVPTSPGVRRTLMAGAFVSHRKVPETPSRSMIFFDRSPGPPPSAWSGRHAHNPTTLFLPTTLVAQTLAAMQWRGKTGHFG